MTGRGPRPAPPRALYRRAVGLGYDERRGAAPHVTVNGEELSADEIVRVARRFGVPVVERKELAEALGGLDADQEIPPDLYEAVAVLLHELERRSGGR